LSLEIGGCRLQFDFPTVKLLDYKGQQESLESSTNPFAHVVLAHLAALATKRNNQNRRREKFTVTRRLYDRGFSRQDIINVYRFIDWVMTLPPALESDFQQQLRKFEGERAMTYITSIERSGIEKGIEQGIEQGRLQERQEMVLQFLGKKFNGVSPQMQSKVAALGSEQLQELSELLMDAAPIDTLTTWLDQH
jgi:flagellar biosynthesis/type III secretory pathway protein FliH